MKNHLVCGEQTLQAYSARSQITVASILDFEVWATDVKLAFLQSTKPLQCRRFMNNPAPEFELSPDECFELLRLLYGLIDTDDLLHEPLMKIWLRI